MNYQWTMNLHDGYPPLQVLLPEEHIPPPLHNLCKLKPTMFHLGHDYFCPTKILLPPGDNWERLLAKVTIKRVKNIEKLDGDRFKNLSDNLVTGNGKVEGIISYSQLVDRLEATANEESEINDDLYKFKAPNGHQGPSRHQTPI